MTNLEDLIEEASAEAPDEGELTRVTRLAEEAQSLQNIIADLEDEVKERKRQLNDILQRQLPDMFAEIGIDEIRTKDGTKFVIRDFVSGSLPKDEFGKRVALEWLEQHGGADIIKATVNLAFGKDEYEVAREIAADLEARGYNPSTDLGVHASTLAAFARDRLKNGEEVNTEILGLHIGRHAKIVK